MTKPWEKYKSESGPWEKYSSPQTQGPNTSSPAGQTMGFVNKGIARGLGMPVDAVTAGVNLIPGVNIEQPAFGSKDIEQKMRGIGADVADTQPKTVAEHTAKVFGETAGNMVTMSGVIKTLSGLTGLTGKLAKNIISTAAKHPYLTMASEASAGIGAGIGRGVAEYNQLEDPTANLMEMGGGVVGGIAPTVALHTPVALGAKGARWAYRKLSSPFSKTGSKIRAQEYIQGLTSDTKATSKAINQSSDAKMPPAVASGEKKLVELYRGIAALNPVEDANQIEKMYRSVVQLERQMRKLGYGSPEVFEDLTKKRLAAIELSMDKRVSNALKNAQDRLDAIPASKRQSAESVVVNQELRNALSAERGVEKKLWSDVPKEQLVGLEKTRGEYQSIIGDLSQAQSEDIPAVLKKSFITNPKGKKSKKLTETTVNEMIGLRSKLLESARIARKDGKWNRARIANDVADAILEDLGVTIDGMDDVVAAPLKAALAQSRKIQERFNSGTIGDILGYSKDGAPALDPIRTLDVSVGRSGTAGAVDLEKLMVSPEAKKSIERYIARSFTDYTTKPDGTVNTVKAGKWVAANEDTLDHFPELRKRLLDANEAQNIAEKTRSVMDARKAMLRDPRVSDAARFLNQADIGTGLNHLFKGRNPTLTMRNLAKQAAKDPSGNALPGLRAGVVEHIMDYASSGGSFNDMGTRTISGNAMLGFIRKNRAALGEIFSKDQIRKMVAVGKEFAKVERFFSTPSREMEIKLKDPASTALRIFARVMGARYGGAVGASSTGGSLQMAQIASGRFQQFMAFLTKNRAEALITDAILSDDPKLLKTLLAPIKENASFKQLREVNTRMNAWLSGAGSRVYEDIQSEMKEMK